MFFKYLLNTLKGTEDILFCVGSEKKIFFALA